MVVGDDAHLRSTSWRGANFKTSLESFRSAIRMRRCSGIEIMYRSVPRKSQVANAAIAAGDQTIPQTSGKAPTGVEIDSPAVVALNDGGERGAIRGPTDSRALHPVRTSRPEAVSRWCYQTFIALLSFGWNCRVAASLPDHERHPFSSRHTVRTADAFLRIIMASPRDEGWHSKRMVAEIDPATASAIARRATHLERAAWEKRAPTDYRQPGSGGSQKFPQSAAGVNDPGTVETTPAFALECERQSEKSDETTGAYA